jgi:MerR family transcriptional regulator, light-induced transcriptional regulator
MGESDAVPDILARDGSTAQTFANLRGGLEASGASALEVKLREIICAEVLPRLLSMSRAKPAQDDPAKLARLLIAGREDVVRGEIAERLASGAPPLAVMTGVLAPVARELGNLWDNDDCDLIDMQRAAGALKRWTGEIGSEAGAPTSARSPSILVQVVPGERHTLGVDIAEALFRGSGWRVARGEARSFRTDLAKHWRDVIGFSLSCDRNIESLKKAIAEAREASRNPRLLVLVGGPIFVESLGLATKLGADFCACTGEMTVQAPNALLNATTMSNPFNLRC